MVTWLMPPHLADKLIGALRQPESHIFFKENRALSLHIRNQLVYEDETHIVQGK